MVRLSGSNTKLMVRPLRDPITGQATGQFRPTTTFYVMTTPEVIVAEGLQAYIHNPTHVDEVWAGDDPANRVTTAYLRFIIQTEYEAKVGRHLKPQGVR